MYLTSPGIHLSGLPELELTDAYAPCIKIRDSADDSALAYVTVFVPNANAERIARAVAAFNAALLEETVDLREVA